MQELAMKAEGQKAISDDLVSEDYDGAWRPS